MAKPAPDDDERKDDAAAEPRPEPDEVKAAPKKAKAAPADDDPPKKAKAARKADDDDDDPPKKAKAARKADDDDDDDDDPPKKAKAARKADDDDDPPKKAKAAREANDDDDDDPPKKAKAAREDDDDDDEDEEEEEVKKPARGGRGKKPVAPARPAWLYVLIGAVVAVGGYSFLQRYGAADRRQGPGPDGDRVNIDKPEAGVKTRSFPVATRQPWIDEGFTLLVPPLRMPSRPDGTSSIEVWIKLPPQGNITVKWLEDQKRNTLVYPPGTIADRLELLENGKQIADVRGTELKEGGEEIFHVYRRRGEGLFGYQWKRDDPAAQDEATRVLLALDRRFNGSKESKGLRINNACGPCHLHAREERLQKKPGGPARATDAAGFFVPEYVLRDRAPVEHHRPREMNVEDPNVKFVCVGPKGDAEAVPAKVEKNDKNMLWPTCADEADAVGIVDIAKGFAAGDEHAKKVCDSRAFLHKRMDQKAREAFKDAFASCKIQ